jgi:hypothetical protein
MDDVEKLARELAESFGQNPNAIVEGGYYSHHARYDGVQQHRHWVVTHYPMWHQFAPTAHSMIQKAKKLDLHSV